MKLHDFERKLYRLKVVRGIALPDANVFAYIQAIDFSALVQKITSQSRSLGHHVWTREAADLAIQLYRNYLHILRKYGENFTHLPPSEGIDFIWHCHILDTVKYSEDCIAIFGTALHHYPYFGMRFEGDEEILDRAFDITQSLHQREFGFEIPSFELNGNSQ